MLPFLKVLLLNLNVISFCMSRGKNILDFTTFCSVICEVICAHGKISSDHNTLQKSSVLDFCACFYKWKILYYL